MYNCPLLVNVAGDVLRVCVNTHPKADNNLEAFVLPTALTTVSDFSVMSYDISASDMISFTNTIEQLYFNDVLNSLLIYVIVVTAIWYDNKN